MRKIYKFVVSAFMVLAVSQGCRAVAASPPRAHIDSPAKGSCVSNIVTINGWSISQSGVKTVEVYINGKKVGNAQKGIKRTDINKKYNAGGAYTGAANSGFSYKLDTTSYLPGNYTITISSISNYGSVFKVSSGFKKASPRIHIDSPRNGADINTDFAIKGWSLDTSGVQKVDIAVDGKAVGSAQTGISRTDVNRIYNSSGCYKGADKSGFLYKIKYGSLTVGSHKVTVTSRGNGGGKVSASFTVNIKGPAPQAQIETPQSGNEYLKDTLTVTGWSLSASGVKSVQVYLDGNTVSSAMVGLSRTDINTKYNADNRYKDGANCGFSLTVTGLSGYKSGDHIVKIVSTGNNGDTVSCESKITRAIPVTGLDSKDFTVNNSDFTITGYALNASGASKVDIYYGKTLLGTATPNLASTDVAAQYDKDGTKYTGASQCRFSLSVSIDAVPYGKGTITAKATGNDGEAGSVSTAVNVVKPKPQGHIDSPANGINFTYSDTSFSVSGWSLNASGVAGISVYIDSTQIDDVTTGIDSGSGVITIADGQYAGAENARFKTGSIDVSRLSYAKHTVKVVVVGNDGGVYQMTRTFSKSSTTYTQYNITLSTMASKNSVSTSLVDPTAIINADSAGIYEFITINYIKGLTAAQINKMLENCGVLKGKGQVFLDAAKTYNVNPLYLVAHARVESGNGTSKLSTGVKVSAGTYTFGGKSKKVAAGTYYNQFGIQAVDSNPVGQGAKYAAYSGWNSVDASIKGGAKWIAGLYIWGGKPNQDTIYKMRFDPGYWDGTYKSCYEYATAKTWAHSIAAIIKQYDYLFDGIQLTFDIPKYK